MDTQGRCLRFPGIKSSMIRWFTTVFSFIAVGAEDLRLRTLVINAGSTGSRGTIFEYDPARSGLPVRSLPLAAKAKPGLHALAPHAVGRAMTELTRAAATAVPDTALPLPVLLRGTGGMRGISARARQARYAAARTAFSTARSGVRGGRKATFRLRPASFDTLSSNEEGYFLALASNFLLGRLDGRLPGPLRPATSGQAMVGVLDMGGASVQLALPVPRPLGTRTGAAVTPADFHVQSFEGYGEDALLRRTSRWTAMAHGSGGVHSVGAGVADTVLRRDPCSFVGAGRTVALGLGGLRVQLGGSGNAPLCRSHIRKALGLQQQPPPPPLSPVPASERAGRATARTSVLALHGFFYAADCARVLLAGTAAGEALQRDWPTPSLGAVEDAAAALCALHWDAVRDLQRQRQHRYTGASQLQGRCHMLNAALVLLRDALELGDAGAFAVTWTDEVAGERPDWPLGAYLWYVLSLMAAGAGAMGVERLVGEAGIEAAEGIELAGLLVFGTFAAVFAFAHKISSGRHGKRRCSPPPKAHEFQIQ